MADENDGQLSTAQGEASLSCSAVAQGENGGECVNCGWHAPGTGNNSAFLSCYLRPTGTKLNLAKKKPRVKPLLTVLGLICIITTSNRGSHCLFQQFVLRKRKRKSVFTSGRENRIDGMLV